jgi:hypothetical protein
VGLKFSLRDLESGCILSREEKKKKKKKSRIARFLRELWGEEIGECVYGTAAEGCGVESRWEVWRKYRDGEFLLKSGETSCEWAN